MGTKDLGMELISRFGFRFLMTVWMFRYSKEENISIHKVIQILKDREIDPDYVAYISYNGYQSFKRLIKEEL